jgi:hypothetical protein
MPDAAGAVFLGTPKTGVASFLPVAATCWATCCRTKAGAKPRLPQPASQRDEAAVARWPMD